MGESGAIQRVLERARRRRFESAGGEDEEKERLGGEVLVALVDLLSDPGLIESLRLYLGSCVEPIILLRRDLGGAVEEYAVDTEGRLIYTWRDTRWDVEEDQMLAGRKMVLMEASDFRGLSLDSVARLHGEVVKGDLWERLAWRRGREGKPGYHEGGYVEESETWRYLCADPDEVPEAARRTRAARRAAR